MIADNSSLYVLGQGSSGQIQIVKLNKSTLAVESAKETNSQVIKFIVIGLLSTGLSFALFALFSNVLHFFEYGAAFLGYLLSMIFNFLCNKFWTFNSYKKDLAESIKYFFLYLSTLVIHTLLAGFLYFVCVFHFIFICVIFFC